LKKTYDISIIVPNYNNGKYLSEFIESVIHSAILPKELVIVDDGSTDDSMKILNGFTYLPFLKVVSFPENRGLTAALNAAIEVATGEYIMRADPDDKLHPDRIERQTQFMLNNPHIDVLGCNVKYFSDKTDKTINQSNFPTDHHEIITRYSKGEHGIQHPTAFLRGDIYKKYRYQKIFPGEDYEIFARMAFDGLVFANLKEPLYFMRVHKGSSTSNLSMSVMTQTYEFRDKIYGTHTSRLWIRRYYLHILYYRKYQTSGLFFIRYFYLLISILCYPSKLVKRFKK
jgi:glycosyltransferase involved in cell wall biosynthesis